MADRAERVFKSVLALAMHQTFDPGLYDWLLARQSEVRAMIAAALPPAEPEGSAEAFLAQLARGRARARKDLEREVMFGRARTTIKQLVQDKVAEGWKPSRMGNRRVLMAPGGRDFIEQQQFGKTALDYARFLIDAARPPAEPEEVGEWTQVLDTIRLREFLDAVAKSGIPASELWPITKLYKAEWGQGTTWADATRLAIGYLTVPRGDPDTADAVLEHTAAGGTLFSELDKDDRQLAKDLGMRWSRREGFWFRVRSRGRQLPTVGLRTALARAKDRGLTIAFDIEEPVGLKAAREAHRDAALERAEMHERRAKKHQAESAARYAGVRAIGDHIPMGQPILVGHHSERRARRDIERMHAGMRASVEAQEKAGRAKGRAASAEARAANYAAGRRLAAIEAKAKPVTGPQAHPFSNALKVPADAPVGSIVYLIGWSRYARVLKHFKKSVRVAPLDGSGEATYPVRGLRWLHGNELEEAKKLGVAPREYLNEPRLKRYPEAMHLRSNPEHFPWTS